MRVYIYVGGRIDPTAITERPGDEDLTIAADSGWHNAALLGVKPKILLGDFDSIGGEMPEAEEIFRVPPEKDHTDTQLAVQLALSRGADDFFVIGGLSGRLDHTLSNLGVLEYLATKGAHAVITDGFNRARYLKNTGALIARSDYTYLSLIAASDTVKGVTVQGCKYPLKNARLYRHTQYAVSNEITGNCALVEVRRGAIYLIESK